MEETRTSTLWPSLLLALICAVAFPIAFGMWLIRDTLPGLINKIVDYTFIAVIVIGGGVVIALIVRAWRRGPDQPSTVTEKILDGRGTDRFYYITGSDGTVTGRLSNTGLRIENPPPLPYLGVTGGGEHNFLPAGADSVFGFQLPEPAQRDVEE